MSLTRGGVFCCYKHKALINNLCALGKHTGQNFLILSQCRIITITHCLVIPAKKINKISRSAWCCMNCSELSSAALGRLWSSAWDALSRRQLCHIPVWPESCCGAHAFCLASLEQNTPLLYT